VAHARYGHDFPAIVHDGNVVGMQFHPEKSHKYGMRLLQNFFSIWDA
jgi:glutamine amidotransferase